MIAVYTENHSRRIIKNTVLLIGETGGTYIYQSALKVNYGKLRTLLYTVTLYILVTKIKQWVKLLHEYGFNVT
jgi:hypothetical protein